jgi:hypothetical protein
MFRKVAPWYAKRFGPANEFNKRVVLMSSRAEFHEILQSYERWRRQFCDADGELLARFKPVPMAPSFLPAGDQPAPVGAAGRSAIPVPRGPVEVW